MILHIMIGNIILKSSKDMLSYLCNNNLDTNFEHTYGFKLHTFYNDLQQLASDPHVLSSKLGSFLSVGFLAAIYYMPTGVLTSISILNCINTLIISIIKQSEETQSIRIDSLALIAFTCIGYILASENKMIIPTLLVSNFFALSLLSYVDTLPVHHHQVNQVQHN